MRSSFMAITKRQARTDRSRRTATILEIETDLIHRYQFFLDRWTESAELSDVRSNDMAVISEFVDSFVERFHFRRVEVALARCEEAGDRILGLRGVTFALHQDRLRDRLEGMRRAATSGSLGSLTAFLWCAKALSKELGRYLSWAENALLPELRGRVSQALDVVIAHRLDLDEATEVSHYAQAENQLMVLEASLGPAEDSE